MTPIGLRQVFDTLVDPSEASRVFVASSASDCSMCGRGVTGNLFPTDLGSTLAKILLQAQARLRTGRQGAAGETYACTRERNRRVAKAHAR